MARVRRDFQWMIGLMLLASMGQPAVGFAQTAVDCEGYIVDVVTMPGRCVMPFADKLGPVRHLVWHPSGAVVAAVRSAPGLILLKDTDGNGVAEVKEPFGPGQGGSGVAWHAGWLYFATDQGVWRYRWPADASRPDDEGVEIITDLPYVDYGYAHNAKGIAIGADGRLYVAIGSPSDNCGDDRQAAPGKYPCPALERFAGVWAFSPLDGPRGSARGERVATGLRNAMALFARRDGGVLAVVHGRDGLHSRWRWDAERAAEQPAEMLVEVAAGADFGWPYCQPVYSPGAAPRYERTPEYADVSGSPADCGTKTPFLHGFPGHWAPMSATMKPGSSDSIVVVFHGSRGRAPRSEQGFHALVGRLGDLADAVPILQARPWGPPTRLMGSAWAPDGTIFISDDVAGRVWAVRLGDPHRRGAASSQ